MAPTCGGTSGARRVYESWGDEDMYLPLAVEQRLLARAGFQVDVPWRRSPFAVIVGVRATSIAPKRRPPTIPNGRRLIACPAGERTRTTLASSWRSPNESMSVCMVVILPTPGSKPSRHRSP